MSLARWLALAASPTFALAGIGNLMHGQLMGIGGSGMGMSPVGGMTVMYGLMALFHAPPWLHLIFRQRQRPV